MTELNKIYNESNLDTMARMPDNSVDSIVTDPPYGLGNEPDPVEVLTAWLDHGYLEVKGSGFMGKEWDAFVPQPRFWKEAFRVLKPGGHVLSFFGTRTYDWGVIAMRLAGFEVRDQLAWVFGSGFPKSHDISKAIDKAAGVEREVVGKLLRPATPKKGTFNCSFDKDEAVVTTPATPEAQQWAGWGSALKPAWEPIVLARKPLSEKTIAANVLKWGTGGINVDGCRVGTEEVSNGNGSLGQNSIYGKMERRPESSYTTSGRFPANLAHDGSPEVLAGFPETQSGFMPAGTSRQNSSNPNKNTYGQMNPDTSSSDTFGDSGSASRFFYCAKADATDRNYGLPKGKKNRHPTVKPHDLCRWMIRLITPPGGITYDPYAGSGSFSAAAMAEGFQFIASELDAESAEVAELRVAARKNLFSIA